MTYQSIYYSVNSWLIIISMLMLVYYAMDMIFYKYNNETLKCEPKSCVCENGTPLSPGSDECVVDNVSNFCISCIH